MSRRCQNQKVIQLLKAAAVGCWLTTIAPPALADTPVTPSATSRLGALDFRQIVQAAKDDVYPAVVFIKCVSQTYEQGKKSAKQVSGSGVVISPYGEVVTNWHIVDKALEVRCLLLDGTALNATVLGTDKDTDLALLQLDLPEGTVLPYAGFGNSAELREGDFVMAMGAPWGLSRSVSIGIVSCRRRFLPNLSEYSLWLQTDAAISPGNSGGPLVNTQGDVVGINTRGTMLGGDMGFAVPSNTVQRVVEQIRKHGAVKWTWLGLRLQPLRDFERNIYFDVSDGVVVSDTDPESPARRAGIKPRDRIVRVGDTAVTAVTEDELPAIRRMLGGLPTGVPVRVELIRGETTMTIEVSPCEKGNTEGEELDFPRWDFAAKSINRFDNPGLHFYRKTGVFVFGIRQPGNAAMAGLRQQDIILEVDGQPIKTLGDLRDAHTQALENLDAKHRLLVVVIRDGLLRQIVLDFSRDFEKK